MNKRLTPFLENIGEATAACLLAMVQGNLLAVSLTHWAIAIRTGLLAGMVATAAILVLRTSRPGRVALVLACTTAVADFVVHAGRGGGGAGEAAFTALVAGGLSLGVGALIHRGVASSTTPESP